MTHRRGFLERAVVDFGVPLLVAGGVLSLVLAVGYIRLGWTDDPEVLTLEGSDLLEHYRAFVESWGSDELIVLGYEVDDAFAPRRLEQLRALTNALLEVDGVRAAFSLDTAFFVDTGPFGPYPRPLVPDDIRETDGIRREALRSRFVRNHLVSEDGRTLLVAVQLDGAALQDAGSERAALAGIESILASAPFRDLSVYMVGPPVFDRELQRLNRRDSSLFTPLVLAIVAGLLWLLFRSLLPTALALAVVGMTLVWTMGLMGWLGIPLTITTSLLPPLLMVVAVADSVHILSGYVARLGEGASRREAIGWTLREIVPSCFWTTVTTALGFASLLLVRIESVRMFGLFAVVGVGLGLVHAVFLLPSLAVRLPLESARPRAALPRSLGLCARAARRPGIAAAILVVAGAIGAFGLPRVEVATHDGEFFRERDPVNQAYRFLEARIGGVTPFEVEIRGPGAGALASGDPLERIHELQARMDRIPELTASASITDLVLTATPDVDLADDAAVARSLFLLRTMAPEETSRWLHGEASAARISARAMAMTSARTEEILSALQAEAARLFPSGWEVRFTGLVPVFAQMEQYLVDGQVRSYGFAVLAIGVAFALLLRSMRLALLALAANVVPIAIAAGIMGFGGIRLDVGTIMVASVALGIIVDDTIHLLLGFRRGLELHGTPEAALDHALHVAGRPALLTSAILVGGFGVLTFSDFQPTAHFGLLVAVAVAGALVADLLVLPAGLLRLARSAGGGAAVPLVLAGVLSFGGTASASDRQTLEVGAFSAASGSLPEEWEPLEFPKIPRHTVYELVEDDGVWVVRAESEDAASGLTRPVTVNLREYPVLRWRWKVERAIERGDVTSKRGDDYAARVYIAFEYDSKRIGLVKRLKYLAARALWGDLPVGAINYVWASRAPPGTIADNPYAGPFVKMIVIESGNANAGQWRTEQRNVYEDFQRAFGEEPPQVAGIAIMTDTDDTGESARALYGDLVFLRGTDP